MATELLLQADIALPSWAWAALVGVIMLVLGSFITRFTKHSEVTISGPVEIRVLQENTKRLENNMEKGFQDLKDIHEAAESRNHDWKKQIFDQLGKMSITEERLSWRLDAVEDELKDIRDKKLAILEKELKDMVYTTRKNGGKGAV